MSYTTCPIPSNYRRPVVLDGRQSLYRGIADLPENTAAHFEGGMKEYHTRCAAAYQWASRNGYRVRIRRTDLTHFALWFEKKDVEVPHD